MPREKELFRDNLERLDAAFPNQETLTQKDVSKYTGIGELTVPKHLSFRKHRISKTVLARELS